MSPRWKPLPGEVADPRRVGESLDRVASSLGVPLASTLSTVFASWPDMVGESVAQHSRPRSLRDGVLVVAVDEPAWATQLRWLEADLLTRLGEALGPGQVARIEVRVQPV
ncbi:MAG: putative RNA-binding protein containing Zn ribbon domain [Actinomycetia bacterium]|nr:putative RNA-binding protein containing Zn ribbon domain [Actinomycetes bacterium]